VRDVPSKPANYLVKSNEHVKPYDVETIKPSEVQAANTTLQAVRARLNRDQVVQTLPTRASQLFIEVRSDLVVQMCGRAVQLSY
jgi:hypothetical protein